MKAVRFHEFGGPDVLQFEDVEDPVPGPGEVTVRVRGVGLNHLDVDIREGISRFPVPLPHTVGYEAAGEIEEVGEGVTGWQAGDRVLVYFWAPCGRCRFCNTGRPALCGNGRFTSIDSPGAFAEQMRAPAETLIRLPDEIDFRRAAATYVAFGTAWHMLFGRARLQAGEVVLINSVGSGIGSAAVQLANLAGAELVIGTSSEDYKLDRASEYGMDAGVNYRKQDIAEQVRELTGGRGVDVVFEHVGGDLFEAGVDSLAKSGRLVTCGAHGGEVVPFDLIRFGRAEKEIIGSFAYTKEEIEQCLRLVAAGRLSPMVHKAFPLEQAREAMETMERREQYGKLVVEP
ncbi:MAG: zinc-binding dehydrogenase [Thermoleophilaceae bacterium]